MLTKTSDRVADNTCAETNARIRRQTEANIEHYGRMGAQAITRRLNELDAEWDIERCLETMAPILTLTGIGLGITTNKRWFFLSVAVQGFFLQHALQGWCPPLPVLRGFGIRTAQEIESERVALKACRGDFTNFSTDGRGSTRQAINVQTR
ncbi:MAG TPA: hypothetical protein VGM98_05500 [Schlesneria sp.]|jgi:hypothetical protein